MEFKEPKPAKKVEEFVNNGVEKVLFFAAAISADAIHSQYEIPDLVNQAKVPEGFPLINVGAWNDDPIVIPGHQGKDRRPARWHTRSLVSRVDGYPMRRSRRGMPHGILTFLPFWVGLDAEI